MDTTQSSLQPNCTGLSAELAFVPFFNLALQQNALPVVYELKEKKLGGAKLTVPELSQLLPDAEICVDIHQEVEKGKTKAETLLGKRWNDGDVDRNALTTVFAQSQEILDLAGNISGNDSGKKKRILAKLQTLLPDAKRIFAKDSPERDRINLFLQAWNEFQEKLQDFAKYAEHIQTENDLSAWKEQIQCIVARSGELRGVLRYRKLRNSWPRVILPWSAMSVVPAIGLILPFAIRITLRNSCWESNATEAPMPPRKRPVTATICEQAYCTHWGGIPIGRGVWIGHLTAGVRKKICWR